MAIVTFWNDNTGKIGQTHSAIALASYFSVEHNNKILLISTRYDDRVLLKAFGDDEKNDMIKKLANSEQSIEMESGIEQMAKLVNSNRLTADMIPNYTKLIYKNRFSIVAAPKAKKDLDYERIYAACKDILNIAKQHYDIVFVDLNNGLNQETTKNILKISDVVILNMEQKPSELEKVVSLRDNQELFKPMHTLILINNYDRKSKYSTKNITREINEKREILSVPYCNLFAEAVQEGDTAEFFLNTRLKRLEGMEDRTSFFIQELKRASDALIYRMQELQLGF